MAFAVGQGLLAGAKGSLTPSTGAPGRACTCPAAGQFSAASRPARGARFSAGAPQSRFDAARAAARRSFAPARVRMQATPPAASETRPAEQPASAAQTFDWRKQWYPVTPLVDFPVGTPYRFSLFDEPLVLWRADEDDQIRCVEDRCPHRAVPLSEGRVVPRSEGCGAGTLECGYHGWQAGKCLRIPQLPAEVPINEARTCIKSYQVTVKQGLVWLWADAGSEGPEEAIPSPDHRPPDMEYVDVVRDLCVHYTVLVENVIDPTHVPFSHHSVQGNRYRAGPSPSRSRRGRTAASEATWQWLARCSLRTR
eukprot:tig00000681_g3067.t1